MELPLFPLNAVLFPGATIPLHIFEERYKQMIQDCLEARRPFGVLLIRRGREAGEVAEPFEIGTTAHVLRVEHLEGGRMNLMCLGGERFRISRISRHEPYLLGDVEVLATQAEDDAQTKALAGKVRELFTDYIRLYLALSNQWARSVEMPAGPGLLADFIGSRLTVDLWARQRLLEELSARRRLRIEVEILRRAIGEMAPRVEAARIGRWRGFAVRN